MCCRPVSITDRPVLRLPSPRRLWNCPNQSKVSYPNEHFKMAGGLLLVALALAATACAESEPLPTHTPYPTWTPAPTVTPTPAVVRPWTLHTVSRTYTDDSVRPGAILSTSSFGGGVTGKRGYIPAILNAECVAGGDGSAYTYYIEIDWRGEISTSTSDDTEKLPSWPNLTAAIIALSNGASPMPITTTCARLTATGCLTFSNSCNTAPSAWSCKTAIQPPSGTNGICAAWTNGLAIPPTCAPSPKATRPKPRTRPQPRRQRRLQMRPCPRPQPCRQMLPRLQTLTNPRL